MLPGMSETKTIQPMLWFVAVAIVLGIVYVATLQTIPNGSSHYFMIDVGETQIVLNVWGTLHATGYPLYVIIGNVLTAILRPLGVDPIVAPALVSMLWGYVTLALLFALVHHLTERIMLAALTMLAFGLIRTVWIHFVIAEIYTFGTAITIGLLCLALWRGEIKGRIYWLALLGGLGVAHHRAVAMMIPALLFAVWPQLTDDLKRLPRLLIGSLVLGSLGFVQYAYLYLRAQANADWVYGQPGTLSGLWDEFIGREASRFIGPPDTVDALITNFEVINQVLIRDLTLPGLLLGILGLIVACALQRYRRAGVTLGLMAAASYGFHVAFYSDVLSALILQVIIPLALGWSLLAAVLLDQVDRLPSLLADERRVMPLIASVLLVAVGVLYILNMDFITDLTTDETGLETIEEVRAAPDGSTVMLAWGPRYFAVAAAYELQDDLQHITPVDDKVDYRPIIAESRLITPEYTLFNQPVDWWQARLEGEIYLQAAGPRLVEINTQPLLDDQLPAQPHVIDETLRCEPNGLLLDVVWGAGQQPERDLSVFVHALRGDDPTPITQADAFAPVYGWRPLTTWLPGEQIRDVYVLDIPSDQVDRVRYGLYQVIDGGFENVLERELQVTCDG